MIFENGCRDVESTLSLEHRSLIWEDGSIFSQQNDIECIDPST